MVRRISFEMLGEMGPREGCRPAHRAQGPGPSVSRTGPDGDCLILAQEARGGPLPYPGVMLICEELFLLLTKDSGKPESRMAHSAYGLTGALLTDLLLAGRISLTEERSPRIYIVSSEPTGHPVLDRALEILPAKDGKRFSSLVSWGKLNPTRNIAQSLEAAGVVRIYTGGLFGSLNPSYPTLDPLPERQLRARIDAALRGVQPPTASDVALLSILQALGVAPTVLPQQETGLSRGELKRRIKELAGESPVGRAVQRAVEAVTMAIIAAGSVAAASSS